MNFENFVREKYEWSLITFGKGPRTLGIVEHIRKELGEVLDNPADLEEWIDVMLLAIDGACRAGHTPYDIVCMLRSKHEKNKRRQWPKEVLPQDQAVQHVKPLPDHPAVLKPNSKYKSPAMSEKSLRAKQEACEHVYEHDPLLSFSQGWPGKVRTCFKCKHHKLAHEQEPIAGEETSP